MLNIKRVYEPAEKSDGKRILVDRLWPRGVSKERAQLTIWLKDIAPSTELRKWFHHDPKKWMEFKKKYIAELKARKELINQIPKDATLLYGARDKLHNEAVVLKEFLEKW